MGCLLRVTFSGVCNSDLSHVPLWHRIAQNSFKSLRSINDNWTFCETRRVGGGLLLASALAFAQSQANTGIIEGMVYDPSGKSVARAQITIINLGTNFTRDLTSDEEGRFRGLLLPLGPYRVTAKATNFGTLVREGLDLAVGQTISLSLTLNISQVEADGLGLGRGADSGIGPRRKFHVSRPAVRARSAEQRPQLSSAWCRSLPASPSCKVRTATRFRSTDRKASTTTFRLTARTTTTPSSASSAAASGRRSPSAWTRSRSSRWWPTARRPSSAAVPAASSTW